MYYFSFRQVVVGKINFFFVVRSYYNWFLISYFQCCEDVCKCFGFWSFKREVFDNKNFIGISFGRKC